MSDTLRERLWNLATEVRSDDDRKTLCDAIAELDRLEAEVKKPQSNWTVTHHEHGYLISGPLGSAIITRTGVQDNDVICGLLESLARPDVVPSTEPVQAAGDGAGVPFAYAYRYHDCIRFNGGHEVNGGKPIEAIPMYTKGQLSAAFSSGAAEMKRATRQAEPEFHGSGKLDDYNAGWDGGVIAYRYAIAAINPSDVAPAEVPNQDKGYRTQTKQETAEKPKPVSLVDDKLRARIDELAKQIVDNLIDGFERSVCRRKLDDRTD